jgi:AcrR family transcriptional regulator
VTAATRIASTRGDERELAGSLRTLPRLQVAEMQRARLLAAAVASLEDIGAERTTVAHITARARVSRRTFYDLFGNCEECVAVLLEDIAARVRRELELAEVPAQAWRERMRRGLWALLCFAEREPALARVFLVHSLGGAGRVRETREALVAQLVAAVDAGRREVRGAAARCTELTAEGVVGAALAILQARVAREERGALTALFGELLAIVVLPYEGAAAARRAQSRPVPANRSREEPQAQPRADAAGDPLQGVAMRLTYRTARLLEGIAAQPGASNRQASARAGIVDQGQVSKLLARLERLGLVANASGGHARASRMRGR